MPVHTSVAGNLATLTLDRPKVNALDLELLRDLRVAFDQVAADSRVRGILLLGKGPAFSAGLDLKSVPRLDPAGIGSLLAALDEGLVATLTCPKPIAVAVRGHAIAGGLVVSLAADFFALGEGDHKLGLTEVAIGVPYPPLPFEVCRLRLSKRALFRLTLEAGLHSPADAFQMGVGDVLVPDPESAARAWLERVSSYPSLGFAETKRQLVAPALERWRAADAAWKKQFQASVSSPEALAAITAALKR